MKKLLTLFVFVLAAMSAWADFTQGNFTYSVNSDDPTTVSVKQASTEISGDLVIPATVTEGSVTYTVTKVSNNGFMNNPNITSVVLPNTMKELGTSSFDGSYNIVSLTLNEGLEIIGADLVWAPSGNPNTKLTSITIPSTVTQMGNGCFTRCTGLKTVTFAGSDADLIVPNDVLFPDSPIETLNLDRNLTGNGTPYSSKIANTVNNVVIGNHVTAITNNAFIQCATLESVTLGANIVSIGDQAFYYCSALTGIAMGDKVKTLGTGVFQYCTSLANVTFGSNVESTGTQCFSHCESLQNIDLTSKMTTINVDFFEYCEALKSVILPEGLTTIEQYAFYKCHSLESLTIPATVTKMGGTSIFTECTAIQTFTIEDSEEPLVFTDDFGYIYGKTVYIGRPLIDNNSGLYPNSNILQNVEDLTIGGSFTTINGGFLKSHPTLKTLVLKDKVSTLEDEAFDGCRKLETADIGGQVTVIPLEAFEGCNSLTSVTFHEGLKELSHGVFYSCDKLQSITFPASLEKVGRAMFNGCSSLTSITIADSDKPLIFDNDNTAYGYGSDNLFYNYSLDEFYLGRNINISKNEVSLVTSAKYITIGSNVTTIGSQFATTANVENVKVSWLTPIVISDDAFATSAYNNATLWVQGGTKDAFGAATGWKNFNTMKHWSYVVTLVASNHGTLAVGTNSAKGGNTLFRLPLGEEFDATLTPDVAYELSAFTNNDVAVNPLPTDTYHGVNSTDEEFVTLSATFTPIVYPITYDLAGGALAEGVTNPGEYTIESADFTLKNPTRRGYNFAGWTGTELSEATKTVTVTTGHYGERSYIATWTPIIYNITYDLAGGALADGETNPATYTIESGAIKLNNPTRTGYTFKGWTGTDLTEATVNVTIPAESIGDRSYVATWEANPYQVAFDANGGDGGTMANQNFVYDTAQKLTENAFTRTGYTFTGWNSKADGTGTPYADKQEVVNLTATRDAVVTMYAQWQPITYYVSFDKNGGTGTDMIVQKFIYDTAQPLFENAYTRKGYNFKEWTTKADGTGDKFTDKQSVKNLSATQDEVVTIYAQWNAINYTIAYDLGGGEVATANPENYTVETATFTLTNPTRTGYTFKGWTGTELSGATMTVTIAKGSTGNREYTATWERNEITLLDGADNSDLLSTWNGEVADVTLSGRTFTKNGQWNTICLPFDLTIAGSVLDGAEVRTLSSTTLNGLNLTLNFSDGLTEIEAGKPYIIRWTSGEPLVNPKFIGVTVKNANVSTNSITADYVTFLGTYAPTALTKDDVTNLYLGPNNKLYYPTVDGFKVNAFRAYFKVNESAAAMGISIDFGNGETTRIQSIENTGLELDSWYTLNGVKLDGKPTQKGVFIHNGTKVVIK